MRAVFSEATIGQGAVWEGEIQKGKVVVCFKGGFLVYYWCVRVFWSQRWRGLGWPLW